MESIYFEIHWSRGQIRSRINQRRVCTYLWNHGSIHLRTGNIQLQRTGHGKYGSSHQIRKSWAKAEVADSSVGGENPKLFRYDRTWRGEFWCYEYSGKLKSCGIYEIQFLQANIVRVGDEYIVNSRKWFTSNASHPNCKIAIFMGRMLSDNNKV